MRADRVNSTNGGPQQEAESGERFASRHWMTPKLPSGGGFYAWGWNKLAWGRSWWTTRAPTGREESSPPPGLPPPQAVFPHPATCLGGRGGKRGNGLQNLWTEGSQRSPGTVCCGAQQAETPLQGSFLGLQGGGEEGTMGGYHGSGCTPKSMRAAALLIENAQATLASTSCPPRCKACPASCLAAPVLLQCWHGAAV